MKRRRFLKRGLQMGLLSGPFFWWAENVQARATSIRNAFLKIADFFFFPGSGSFVELKKIVNQLIKPSDPMAILQTSHIKEMSEATEFCGQQGIPLRIRSGGHSFESFCMGDGVVIDVRLLKGLEIQEDEKRVKVGGGVTLGELREFLESRGFAFPTGSCPTVGVAGYLLGGGHSKQSRLWGLGADRVQAMNVITASGARLHVSPNSHQDLYWSLLGGGGGNFAIVTSFYLDLIPSVKTLAFSLQATEINFEALFSDWEMFMESAPDTVAPNLYFSVSNNEISQVRLAGIISVDHEDDREAEEVFLANMPENLLQYFEKGQKRIRFVKTFENPTELQSKTHFKGTSQYADKKLGQKGFVAIENIIKSHLVSDITGVIEINPFGGKILRPQRQNSYPHREALYTLAIFLEGPRGESPEYLFAVTADFHQALDPLFSGRHYVNYPDRTSLGSDWAQRYYGDSLDQLKKTKKRYDPQGCFDYGSHSLTSLL